MINKIYKTIHNRFSIFFKFVFFIRYLFVVFFVATLLFLVIPHFFDYKKKEKIIYDYLFQSYDLKINEIETIKYSFFPVPHLEIINSQGNLFSKDFRIKINNLKLYPSLINIYNFNNYQIKKIELHTNKIQIDYFFSLNFFLLDFFSSTIGCSSDLNWFSVNLRNEPNGLNALPLPL